MLKSSKQDASRIRPAKGRLFAVALLLSTSITASALSIAITSKPPLDPVPMLDHDTVFKVKGDGCPVGSTLVTYQEATGSRAALSQKLNPQDSVRLADGGAMDGSHYGASTRKKDDRVMRSSLCKTLLPVTAAQIMQIAPEASASRVHQLVPYLNQMMAQYGINTRLRQAHFVAQVAHESDRFNALECYASGTEYEGRRDLGNTQPGDGVRFKPRGLVAIVGRTNYAAAGRALGVDLINNPQRLAELDLATLSAGWFWSSRQLNGDADKDDVKTITRIINGGHNGLDDRTQLLQAAKKTLGV